MRDGLARKIAGPRQCKKRSGNGLDIACETLVENFLGFVLGAGCACTLCADSWSYWVATAVELVVYF